MTDWLSNGVPEPKRCRCCALTRDEMAYPPFCQACIDLWVASPEHSRASLVVYSLPRPEAAVRLQTSLADFAHRVQAENLHGERPEPILELFDKDHRECQEFSIYGGKP